MKRDITKTEFKSRVGPCFGDGPTIHGMSITKVWLLLYYRFGQGVALVLKQWLRYNNQALAFCQVCTLRTKFGIQNIGFLISLYATGLMVCINSEHIHSLLAPFVVVAIPVLLFVYDWGEVYDKAFVEIKSLPLLVTTIFTFVSALVNTLMCYMGFGNANMVKRGESLIFIGLSKLFFRLRFHQRFSNFKPSEFFVICFLECGLTGVLGMLFIMYWDDPTFGWFLVSVAASELVIQLKSKAKYNHEKSQLGIEY